MLIAECMYNCNSWVILVRLLILNVVAFSLLVTNTSFQGMQVNFISSIFLCVFFICRQLSLSSKTCDEQLNLWPPESKCPCQYCVLNLGSMVSQW